MLSVRGAGRYATAVALKAGLDAEQIARRLREIDGVLDVQGDGMLVITVDPARVVTGAIGEGAAFGRADVPRMGWDDRPRTWQNPGFVVRYAYARAVWTERWAAEAGVRAGEPRVEAEAEQCFAEHLADLPGRAAQAEREQDPRPFAFCLERLAAAYHDVHERCPALPMGDSKPGAAHASRVTLARAARVALGNGLTMLGETPRERI
ncbi:arginyl-tRNA synthetase [Actinomadura rubteroloni]|uniref:Arginyl-tRNA synthetase n=1 Tax=Actinomadura rubteroloni TaxID=1926885 RepID=A0A2P4UJK7_9ACTN|nr:arginyl-tRNA synthetase [Actinomadura rubteroloni]